MHLIARALLSLLAASAVMAQGKNVLFYGNSYTFYTFGYGVPELVGLIATEAGQPTPTIVQALIGGSNLGIHATDPAQVAVISNGLPASQTWDHVVIQENSVGTTPYFGFSTAAFRANALTIMGNVRNHSPTANAVMYQTWARAWGHMYYPSPWAVPMDMHNMVRGNYDLAVNDINATYGAGSAHKAAVGDAVALLEWQPSWYHPDLSHPTPAITLLAAMCIYTTIYGQTACEIDPDFTQGSPLETALTPHAIDETIWNQLAGIADRSATPATRRFPGSADHLLLETATNNDPLTACPTKQVTTGTQIQIQMRSMNGVYDGALGWLLVDFIATGSPPGPGTLFPELQVDLGGVIIGPTVSLSSALTVSFTMPFTLPGGSFLVQGLAAQPSSETGNQLFTATDAHELVMF
ncbi:MAG: hypothetical protein ACI9SE_003060 [Neolewinella sp.]|jgi:hypothetical protein